MRAPQVVTHYYISMQYSYTRQILLYLPFPAKREDTVARGDFEKWIINNIYNCMRLAEERGMGVNHMEDIILVTGRHLARSWVRVIFSESRGGAVVSFVAQASGDSVVHFEERNASGARLDFYSNDEVGFCRAFKDLDAEISLIRRIL